MVRIKNTTRYSTAGAPPRCGKPVAHYEIGVEAEILDSIMDGTRKWYCWCVDTETESETIPSSVTDVTFTSSGCSVYRTVDCVYRAPRGKLGDLLKNTQATKDLNGGEECDPQELADEFETSVGWSEYFWGWGLVRAN